MVQQDGRLARGLARRESLLTAALDVVADDGGAALTHRAVAARADCSAPAVLYHFSTVADLKRETLRHAGELISAELGRLLDAAADPAAVPAVAADLAVALVTGMRPAALGYAELMLEASRVPGLRDTLQQVGDSFADLLQPYSGGRRDRAFLAAGAMIGHLLVALSQGDELDLAQFRIQIEDVVKRFDPHPTA